jgi:hypothetical protein
MRPNAGHGGKPGARPDYHAGVENNLTAAEREAHNKARYNEVSALLGKEYADRVESWRQSIELETGEPCSFEVAEVFDDRSQDGINSRF